MQNQPQPRPDDPIDTVPPPIVGEAPVPPAAPFSPEGVLPPRHQQPSDLICQLWFEQFRQLAWFSATAAGGTLLLAERGYVDASERLGFALVLFALAAFTAFIGQDKLVDHLTAGRGIQKSVRAARLVASALLGTGAGVLLSFILGG